MTAADGVVHREREGEGRVAAAELLEDLHAGRVPEPGAACAGGQKSPVRPDAGDRLAGVDAASSQLATAGRTTSRTNAAAASRIGAIISAPSPGRPNPA